MIERNPNIVFEDAADLNVRANIIYGKAADHKLYWKLSGSTYSDQVKQAELENLFSKGLAIIKVGNAMLIPVAVNGNLAMTVAKTGAGSEAFDAADTYNVGDRVTKDGKIYQCKTQISVAAAWDATKWNELVSLDWTEWAAEAPAAE